MFKKLLPFLILSLLLIPSVWPLLQHGFFVTDDGNWMVIRLSAFHQALRDGQFPIRFLPSLNHGYGYPVLNFLYPLPFYLGEIIHLLHFSFLNSIKILFGLSFVLSGFTMYALCNSKWNRNAGLLAAFFYATAPYHLFDVYKRGSIGESVAFIFPPLIFYFLRRFFAKGNTSDLIFASFSLAALILAHNVVAFLFLPAVILYLVFKVYESSSKRNLFLKSGLFIFYSLALSSFFWVPALYDLRFTRAASVQVASFSDNFLDSVNFWTLVGPLAIATLILGLTNGVRTKNWPMIAVAFLTIASLVMATSISSLIWEITPLPRLVQFPWRFLSLEVFGISLLVGYIIFEIRNKLIIAIFALFTLLLTISQIKITTQNLPDSFYETNDDTTTVKNEYMPIWVKNDPVNRPDHLYKIISTGEEISSNEITMNEPGTILANQVYFPGQTVLVGGNVVPSGPGENGLLKFNLPSGSHTIRISFLENPFRLAFDFLSLISLVGGCLVVFFKRKK